MVARTTLLTILVVACGGEGAPSGPPAAPPDVAAPPADATCTPSGLCTRVLVAGTGTAHPLPTSTVAVRYTGWQASDGARFDTTFGHPPVSFPVGAVIEGWTEGLQLMVVGETRRMWIPSGLAYGDSPGGLEPAGALVFDVELVEIH